MTVSNASIHFDRPYVEEVEEFEVVQPSTRLNESQNQEILVFDDEATFNRKRSLSRNEVIDNAKFRTNTAFNSGTACSPSGHVWRFAKSIHGKLTGG